jgi:TPP-dependent indolepyruvate ferredoxin oxidoreductase alpha subunit
MKVKIKRSGEQPPDDAIVVVDYSKPKMGPWSADKLYALSKEHRRVLILEMMTWVIAHAEQIEMRAEWDDFKRELESVRIETKGQRPWPQATKHERCLAHLVELANTFVKAEPVADVSGEGGTRQDHAA